MDYTIERVNGAIIGDIVKTGRLYYDGRQHGPQFSADDDDGLRDIAKRMKQEFLDECNGIPHIIYPNNTWELRILD